ncbi:MAG: type IV pilus secretin PilQ [Thermodesulfovibrionia bacterium]|nr:type IV pilus secretin PilQ [Thermodesulfovibrionia bacterium]
MILKRVLLFLLLFACFMALPHGKSRELLAATPEITGINVKETNNYTEIHIETNAPFLSYTVYKPEDPYSVVVELQGVELHNLREKIVIDKAGVMEIVPSMIEGDLKTVRLDIKLTVPAEVKPVQKEGGLVLTFFNPEAEEVMAALVVAETTSPLTEVREIPEPLAEEEKGIGIIKDITFTKSEDKAYIVIRGDTAMSPKVFEIGSNKLVVDIPDVLSAVKSFEDYELPVLGVRIGEESDKTRIVFDLMESTEYDVSPEGKQVRVSFAIPEMKVVQVPRTETIPAAPVEQPGVAEREKEPFATSKYVGEKISLDFQDADLLHIFRLLADISGYNIVVSPQVSGKFSMKLTDVPWDQALDIILRNYGLSKTIERNVIRVAPTAVLAQEEETIAKAKEAQLKAGDLVTRVYPVNYADVQEVQEVITDAKLMTDRGYISIDERTSALIIRDVSTMHKEFENLLVSIDKATPQVNIEAKIVEVTKNFTQEFGIQWGILWTPPGASPEIGSVNIPGGTGFHAGNPLAVNLPAAVGPGAGGALGLGYINATQTLSLDIQLSAMEASGQGKIISNPRITTLDNQEAKIQQGKKIPYQSVDENGVPKTEFVDASLELTVTPHITPENTIVMIVESKKNEADFSQTVGGVPTIDTNEATTKVLIKDGDTLVIGGIFKTSTAQNVSAVPVLSKIPILGWLFKKKQEVETSSELLIFITPRIVKDL